MRLLRTLLVLAVLGGCTEARAPDGGRSRVVSLHQVTTEIVVAVGASNRLVGVMQPLFPTPELDRALAGVPRVAGLESILAVDPNVVFGLGVVAEQSPELVSALEARGIEVVIGNPASLDDVVEMVWQIGASLGAETRAKEVAEAFRARLGADADGEGAVPVFVYDCCDPPFTAGGRAVLTDVLRRAGGANIFADQAMDWGKVSWEAVVERAPALIVIHDYEWGAQGDVRAKRERLRRVPGLASVPTVALPLRDALGGLTSARALPVLRAAIEDLDR